MEDREVQERPYGDSLPTPDSFSNDGDDDLRRQESRSLLHLGDVDRDVERQSPSNDESSYPSYGDGAEYSISTRTKLALLGGWFTLNLGLTIYNKAVLGVFAFPWLLTSLHAICLFAGCFSLYSAGMFKLSKLSIREDLTLVAFSILFTANISVSNISLAMVSIPFHSILRSTCPAMTVILYRLFYSRTYSTSTYLTLIPIIGGAALATYGDVSYTLAGFLMTLFGVFLATVKGMAMNRLMVGHLRLSPLELLLRLSPLAATQSLLCALLAGEWTSFMDAVDQGALPRNVLLAVLGNGVLAFVLNISSFETNKATGALTMAVAANTKQILTVALGFVLFHVPVTLANAVGTVVTLAGAAWYSKVELDSNSSG